MQFLRQVRTWLAPKNTSDPSPLVILNETMQSARQAQYAENYDEALDLLDAAMQLAESSKNATLKVDINLTRADILIAKADYKTASFVLNELKEESTAKQHRAPLAYALASMGLLEQERGNWEAAQGYYEQAREIANEIKTDGAGGRASAHLADVYLHEGNASYALHLLKEALPRLQTSGDKELLGYFQAVFGRALIATGQVTEGLEAIRQGLEAAHTLKHRAQIRYLSELLGEQYLALGDYPIAQRYYLDALQAYSPSAPLTASYITSLCQTSKIYYKLGELQQALKYAQDGLDAAEKFGDMRLLALAKGIYSLAQVQQGAENRSYLEEALHAYEKLSPDIFYLDLLRQLAQAHLQAKAYEQAQATYTQALQAASDFPLQAAQIQSDLATVYYQQGRYREAVEQLQKALASYTDLNHHAHVARLYCELGALYARIGDGRMALRQYGDALMQVNRLNDMPTRGFVLASVALAYSDYGDIDSALDFFKEALEIAKRSNNLATEATRRGNYGRLLLQIGQYKQALNETQLAKKMSFETGLSLPAALYRNNLGLIYRLTGQAEKALEEQNAALAEMQALKDKTWEAFILAELGDTYLNLNRDFEASQHYEQALQMAKAENALPALFQAQLGQVQLALKAQNTSQAESLLKELEAPLKRAHLRRLLAEWHGAQSQLAMLKDDKKAAETSWNEAASLRRAMQMPEIQAVWLG